MDVFLPAKDDRKQRSIVGTFSERLNNRNRLQGFHSRVATENDQGGEPFLLLQTQIKNDKIFL
jgi:hypothetical protein